MSAKYGMIFFLKLFLQKSHLHRPAVRSGSAPPPNILQEKWIDPSPPHPCM